MPNAAISRGLEAQPSEQHNTSECGREVPLTPLTEEEAFGFLAYAFRAGVLESPKGCRQLQQLREHFRSRGWDIGDESSPIVQRCLHIAVEALRS